MKITIVSDNSNLVSFLRVNPSVIVHNVYTDLTVEYDKFVNDLNSVDVLLLVDYVDLSSNMTMITKAIKSGHAYLLDVKEFVVVTYEDYSSSPTVNAKDKFKAFGDLLGEYGYSFRLVQPHAIEFHTIYEAIIRETQIADNDLQIFDKYKVSKSSGGVNIKPKKSGIRLAAERGGSGREALLKQDAQTEEVVRGRQLDIPKEEPAVLRNTEHMTRLDTLDASTTPLVLISGVKYSGKSTFMVRAMLEMFKNGFGTLGVDATSRCDLKRLQPFNNAKFPVLQGTNIFMPTEDSWVGLELFHPSPTASFFSSLTHLTSTKTCVFCEVDLKFVSNYLNTYVGKKALVIVTEYDFVKIRDLTKELRAGEFSELHVVVNTRYEVDEPDTVERTVREYLPQVVTVSFITDMVEAITNLGVC